MVARVAVSERLQSRLESEIRKVEAAVAPHAERAAAALGPAIAALRKRLDSALWRQRAHFVIIIFFYLNNPADEVC